ncbi:efflux RND transporter permease subunit [Clostridium boliviensis]|uniref:Efflux RND transporter permease subunit n=1 Tax=Clostridium boliviensis TaxID=318465 RepID=A0ABU4GGG1_9CLOT|nr:efflux RND transporter permease subunit [Clostridium boliviensis]MDW2796713.1 efflux RND transporter permease subunit [Clostridium boliviensis]
MNQLTKIVLRRPVTVIMCLLCLVVFGASSVLSSRQELTPEMSMPMLMVVTPYPGAQPKDVDELISKKIENSVGALSGIKKVTSKSSENRSTVTLQYEYGTDLDKAYDDLKKKIDEVSSDLPGEAKTPIVMELDTGSSADIKLVVTEAENTNQYDYVKQEIVPEFEKLSNVAEVSVAGGSGDYIKVELSLEKMQQYKLTMSSIANDISASDVKMPGGTIEVGRKKASISSRLKFDTEDSLQNIPLTVSGNNIVYLGDIADIYETGDKEGSIAHYNGESTVSLSISKQQSSTAAELSKEVNKSIKALETAKPGLDIQIVNDSSKDIMASLISIAEIVILAIVISMLVIWLFFGDLKASFIVGSSIPVSILTALIMMKFMDFSLNMLTLAALSMGVGMMVDNSIVVMESCFRVTAQDKRNFIDYFQDALKGTGIVSASVLGSTLTTCVVFLPLAFLNGMAGQMFKPLGFTIVFCMGASLISAITVVPLCYLMYKPEETSAILAAPIQKLQNGYRKVMHHILPKKKTVMAVSILLLVISFLMAGQLNVSLITADDQGQIAITVDMAPGLKTKDADELLKKVEDSFSDYSEMESYITSYGGSGVSAGTSSSIIVYLKENRKIPTSQAVDIFKQKLSLVTDCKITVKENSYANMISSSDSYQLILKSTDYNQLKNTSGEIVSELMERPELTRVHSTLENAAPVVEVAVDSIKAKAKGITPSSIGHSVYQAINGVTAKTIEVDSDDVDVKVQYPEDEFKSVDQIRNMTLSLPNGGFAAVNDVADISFQDSPASITREDKEYMVTISADYTSSASKNTKTIINKEIVTPNLTPLVSLGTSSIDDQTTEELTSLLSAIMLAVFLVFVVMAAQFESPRFSFMVMTTIPFSLIGAFGLMFFTGSDLSMVAMLGFLMLIGTVVNSGILYVDTVNQYKGSMSQEDAMIEAGATRLRPILMTTLTTVLSMIPMALALGHSGKMMQGLAVVNIGGLTASTVLSLLMLPVYYNLMSKKEKRREKIK